MDPILYIFVLLSSCPNNLLPLIDLKLGPGWGWGDSLIRVAAFELSDLKEQPVKSKS